MDDNTNSPEKQVEKITLLESLDGEIFKLPLIVMRDVGPAVQTLAGLMKITSKETFVPVETIALKARLPLYEVRRHIIALDKNGWINNRGRERTRRGMPRRTATLTITKQTKDHLEPYGFLPWWACCNINRVGKLPWSVKAVLSVFMKRLCSLKAAVEKDGPDDDPEGQIENMGGDDRFQFSLTYLMKETGLTHDSVTTAKQWLAKHKVVRWMGNKRDTHYLAPNWDFAVVVTPTDPSHCHVGFGRREG